MKKIMVLAAIIAFGIGSVSLAYNAFAANQKGTGTSTNLGQGGGGSGPGNQGTNGKNVGNNNICGQNC